MLEYLRGIWEADESSASLKFTRTQDNEKVRCVNPSGDFEGYGYTAVEALWNMASPLLDDPEYRDEILISILRDVEGMRIMTDFTTSTKTSLTITITSLWGYDISVE